MALGLLIDSGTQSTAVEMSVEPLDALRPVWIAIPPFPAMLSGSFYLCMAA